MTVGFTIVLNGALTLRQCIEHHAPVLDKHIIVEGAALPVPSAENGDGRRVTGGDSHSSDDTLSILEELKERHPNLVLLQRKGCWPGKTAMVQGALDWLTEHDIHEATLVELDYDEFWFLDDLRLLIGLMQSEGYSDVEVYARHFWPSVEYHTRISRDTWGNQIPWRRLFAWSGENAVSHEPPIFNRLCRILTMDQTRALGVLMFHYSYCTESQFQYKERFYGLAGGRLSNERKLWMQKDLTKDSPHGPLVRFAGEHPIDVGFLKGQP